MTADEVLEAMADGIFRSANPWMSTGLANEPVGVRKMYHGHARAAVRAAHAAGAILVAEMPGEMDWRRLDGIAHGMKSRGWNDALAAVRAKAIGEGE